MNGVPIWLMPDFQAFNKNLTDMRRDLSLLRHELESLKTGQLEGIANSESDSNIYIVPKDKPDTGELRRRRYYLHEKISDHYSPGELVSLMYSMGIDPGDIPGEAHNEVCLQFVMYCERHGYANELLTKLRAQRPRSDWIV